MPDVDHPTTESDGERVVQPPAQLRSRYADHQLLGPLVVEYVAALPEILAQITSAFEANEFAELKRLCHRLCGEAATFGFEPLALAARRLEVATAHSDLEDLRDAQSSLMDCSRRIAV